MFSDIDASGSKVFSGLQEVGVHVHVHVHESWQEQGEMGCAWLPACHTQFVSW